MTDKCEPTDAVDPHMTASGATVRNPAIADLRSHLNGAVLTSAAEPIVADIEFMLEAPGRGVPNRSGCVSGGISILDRGEVVIIPLGWAPAEPSGDVEEYWELQQRMNALATSVRSSCEHRHGTYFAIDLQPSVGEPSAYADALIAAGARRANWWRFGDYAVVLVTQGQPIRRPPTPITRSSLHIVPLHTSTSGDVVPGIDGEVDLSWSWSDVVAAAECPAR